MLFIIVTVAWMILPHAARLCVAAIAIGYGVMLAIRVRSSERKILAFALTGEHVLADFDRKPARNRRRALRQGLTLALHQTQFRSLFPDIAHRTNIS